MSYLSPVDYLPHDAPMMLLGSVERVTDDSAVCRVAVNGQSVLAPFLNAEGDLPGWYALELMGADRWRLVRLASPAERARSYCAGHGAGCARVGLRQWTFRKRRDAGHHRQTADAG